MSAVWLAGANELNYIMLVPGAPGGLRISLNHSSSLGFSLGLEKDIIIAWDLGLPTIQSYFPDRHNNFHYGHGLLVIILFYLHGGDSYVKNLMLINWIGSHYDLSMSPVLNIFHCWVTRGK